MSNYDFIPTPEDLKDLTKIHIDKETVLKDISELLISTTKNDFTYGFSYRRVWYKKFGFDNPKLTETHQEIIEILKEKGYEVEMVTDRTTSLMISWRV